MRAAHNCLIVFWTRSEASPRLKLYNLWSRQTGRPGRLHTDYTYRLILYVHWELSLDDTHYLPNRTSSSFLLGPTRVTLFQKRGAGYCFRLSVCRASIDRCGVWHCSFNLMTIVNSTTNLLWTGKWIRVYDHGMDFGHWVHCVMCMGGSTRFSRLSRVAYECFFIHTNQSFRRYFYNLMEVYIAQKGPSSVLNLIRVSISILFSRDRQVLDTHYNRKQYISPSKLLSALNNSYRIAQLGNVGRYGMV